MKNGSNEIMLAGQNLDGYLVNYQPGSVDEEKNKAEGALTAVADILSESVERMQKNEDQKEQAAIMEAHRMMVQDPALHDSIISKIEELGNAPQSVLKAAEEQAAMFESMEDEYFAARAVDLRDVGKRIAKYILGVKEPEIGDEKVILFTSSTSGEGKTFNAANLAVSFALLGKKVILCGLDIRKPALGRLFGVSDRSMGITALLTHGELTKGDVMRQVQPSGLNDNLDLLLAGPVPPNPTELLARENFMRTMDILKESYDYVILDTAPVGLVSDTLQIARYANVCCYVCRADYTPKSNISLLNDLAEQSKLVNPCVILNGVDMSKRKYGYYYGYGKYGKYGR